jgi:curved DNA-binding protein
LREMFDRSFGSQHGANSNRESVPRPLYAELSVSLDELIQKTRKTISIAVAPVDAAGAGQGSYKKIAVKIPPGVTEGSTIRLKGQGESAFGHNTAGDLLLKIKIKPDDRFALNGYDLHSEVAISPWEAALGTKVDIETSTGLVRLKIPAGTQSGRQFRLKGKGLPKKLGSGDLLITARITIPDSLSDTERKLFAELAEKSAFDPRETYQKQTVKEAA